MKLFKTNEAAKFLGVSVKTIKRWRKSGKLIPTQTGDNGYCLYSAEQLGTLKSKLGTFYESGDTQTRDTKSPSGDKVTNSKVQELKNCTGAKTGKEKKIMFENEKTPNTDGAGTNYNADSSTADSNNQVVSVEKRVEMAAIFLMSLNCSLPRDKEYFTYLWIKHFKNKTDKKTITFNAQKDHWQAARTAIEYNDKGYDIYFGVHLTDSPMDEHLRAKEENITAQTAIIADLDCKSAWHIDTDKKKFPTIEQAKTFLPFEPSILVDSGGGLHSYILLNEPIKFSTDAERKSAKERNQNYIEMIRENAKGYTGVDGVADLARVLRLPGTYNFKNGVENAPLCKVLDFDNAGLNKKYFRHDLDTLIKKPEKKSAETKADSSQKNFNNSDSAQKDFSDFTNNADYDQWRALKMLDCIPCSSMTYDDWRSIGMALKNIGCSVADFIHWSSQDSRFKVGECEYKWQTFDGSGLTIATIHSYAKDYGYDEKATRREWFELHPELQTKGNAWQNSDFAQDKNSDSTNDNRADEKTDSDTADKGTPKLDDTEKFALFSLPHSDLYNSRRILIFHGKNIRYLTDSGKWYTYKNNVWTDGGKENGAILPYALNVADLIFHNADSAEETGAEEKLKKAWQSRKTISNAIELLKGENKIRITEQDLNTHKNLLNCKNGVIDLQTGKLYPHDSKLLLTQCVNAEYIAGYHNETVDKFLRDVLPDTETLQALLRYLGYCLTGEVSAEKALFIHGLGGNGKGTLTKLLFNLLGDYACGFPIESILTQPYNRTDGDSATPAFNKLLWRRLAVAEEIPAGRKLDYAKFKILTGGDALPIRKLHQEATEIKDPVHKFIFSGNHLPELDDAHDPGILRRWIQIKFEQDFTGDKGDETLKHRLQTQDSLSAMLNLLVENAVEWYKDGLIVSDKMKADRDNYFAANDFISDFISEFCVRGNGLSIKRKDFLQQLKEEYPNETRGKSDQELTSAVAKIEGISYKRGTGGGYRFFNVGLRDLQENQQ